jgi:hypothetical protein
MTRAHPWLSPKIRAWRDCYNRLTHAQERSTHPNTIASLCRHIPSSASLRLFFARAGNPCNRKQKDDKND